MALFNYATKEITLKIVYYGPGLSGKTTNLQHLHSVLNPETKGRLLSLSTETDRTLFFDFLPVELGKIRDFSIRFQLYTVPGQVKYNATRKIVLKGADAVIFIADSQREMREQNIQSFENMRENLSVNNINPDDTPIILQYNKRDLSNVASVEELNSDLNRNEYNVIEACAIKGSGVEESFKLITKLLLKFIAKKHQIEIQPAKEEKSADETAVSSMELPSLAPVPLSPEVQTTIPAEEEAIPADEDILDKSTLQVPEEFPEKDYKATPEPEITFSPQHRGIPAAPAFEERIPVFPDDEEKAAVLPIDKAVNKDSFPVFPVEKIDLIIEEIAGMQSILTDIKNSVYVLSKEMKDLKDIRREHTEIGRALKDLSVRLDGIKTRKSWFRF